MKTTIVFFAAARYWKDSQVLQAAYEAMCTDLGALSTEFRLIVDGQGLDNLHPGEGEVLVAVPMSGAVQQTICTASQRFAAVIVYAGYVRGNFNPTLTDGMLAANAAPTVMDVWAVLHRTHPRAQLAVNPAQLADKLQVLYAWDSMHHAKLLLVGETEPWVISSSRELTDYTRGLGVTVEQVPQQELAALYAAATDEDGAALYEKYRTGAQEIREPNDKDLRAACRMAWAVVRLLEIHGADGAAFACFDLLKVGTTACLGVSYVNDCTPMVAACEGDLDSACTMLLMKKLTRTKLWMANPAIQPDGTILFSHCTAPVNLMSGIHTPYILRSHHESGIGVGIQTQIPAGTVVTACRISQGAAKMTIHRGVSQLCGYQPCCRTQLCVAFDQPDHYLQTALGCHQVFAFEDLTEKLNLLGAFMGLELL